MRVYSFAEGIITNTEGVIMSPARTIEHLSETPLQFVVRLHKNKYIVAAFALQEDALKYATEPFYEVYDVFSGKLIKEAKTTAAH